MARTLGRSVLVLAAAALAFALLAPASSGEPKPPGHNCPNPAGNLPPGQCKKLEATTTTSTSSTTSTTMAPSADLTIQKSFIHTTASPFNPVGTATYQVIVTNLGPSPAANVVVVDQSTTPVTGASGATCGPLGTPVVTCQLGTVSPGPRVFQIHVQDPFVGPTFDQVQVTSSTPDPNPANNSAGASGP